jgi:RNA-directed DNA polymerase
MLVVGSRAVQGSVQWRTLEAIPILRPQPLARDHYREVYHSFCKIVGGVISPILANMTLDGLEQKLQHRFGRTQQQRTQNKVHLSRFADDFVVTGSTKELLEDEVQPIIAGFLEPRGLTLSATKTRVTHINAGFVFLGQNVRKYRGKLLIRPSNNSVKELLAKVRAVLKANPQAKAGGMCQPL